MAWERHRASCWHITSNRPDKKYKPFPRSLSAADRRGDTAWLSCRPIVPAVLEWSGFMATDPVSLVLLECHIGVPGTAWPDCTSLWDCPCSMPSCHCSHPGRRGGIDTQAFAQRVRNYLNSFSPSWFCCWYSYSHPQQCFVINSCFQNLFITTEARDKKLFFFIIIKALSVKN